MATEDEVGLPSLITQIGAHQETWEASTASPQLYDTTIEYQHAGTDRRWIAGTEFCTGAGTLSVFAAGTRIDAERIPAGRRLRVEYLSWRGPMAALFEKALGITAVRPLIFPDAPAGMALSVTNSTRAVFERSTGWNWQVVAILADLTRTLMTARSQVQLPAAQVVIRARRLVEESPRHPWSVKEVSALLGVRREMLWEVFKGQTGLTPGEWIRRHRIRVAQRLLERGMSVRATAEHLGFSSRQHFARSFRMVTGRAPSLR
ncbi:MAG: AraC family transcriptional regulator [bacterium]